MYHITIKKSAQKELLRLPVKVSHRIAAAIEALKAAPRPKGSKKLKGASEELWRIRIGDYRVIYEIDDFIKIVDIRRVGHRKDIYE